MLQMKKIFFFSLLLLALPWFSGVNRCTPNPSLFTVGGNLSGLVGTVVLQNNGVNDLSLTSDGDFVFTDPLEDGSSYSVTVLSPPSNQICSVANGSGTLSGANISNIAVVCSNEGFSVGGTVSGLTGTVILQNNSGDNLSIEANGSFTFPTEVANGATYEVTLLSHPNSQDCTLSNASGTIDGATVTNVGVTCVDSYSVGGTVSGLYTGYEMQLSNNGSDDIVVPGTADGNASFTFTTNFENGAAYDVTITSTPQDCDVSQGSGSISGASISDVVINCAHGMLFLSTDAYDGNLQGSAASGIEGADEKCAADSQCPAGFVCQAVLVADSGSAHERTACSTANCSGGPSEHVDWVLLPLAAYTRLDGTVVGITNANAIFDFDLVNGVSQSQALVWAGFWSDWTNNFWKCFQWDVAGPNQGSVGDAGAVDNFFLDFFQTDPSTDNPACTDTYPIICVAHDSL